MILIGAGPGDPELITVKGWRILQEADVILYDRLSNPALLDLAPDRCEKIFVGKQPFGPTVCQDTIHEIIREKAKTARKIVRLKGGDPFIFGRGYEEVLCAAQLGLEVTYVPGISSMQTAGLAGIPLTHRGISDGIWIITGTRTDGSLSGDLRLALRSKATVVIYMGMHQLTAISQLYRQEGYGKMPAAIIREASLPGQQVAVGTAGQLAAMAKRNALTNPAIIIIGEVVSFAAVDEKDENNEADLRSSPDHSGQPSEIGPILPVVRSSNPPLVL